MADALANALAALAQSIQTVVTPSPSNPLQFAATLSGFSLDDRGDPVISYVDTLEQMTASVVNLSFLTKSVRFTDLNITDLNTVGGMPIPDLLTLNIGNVTSGATSPPGVPGLLGAISGTFQLPLQTTQTLTQQIAIDLKWQVLDENGHALSDGDVAWSVVKPPSPAPLQAGTSGTIAVLSGLALDTLQLTFNLAFVEATAVDANNLLVPPVLNRTLIASLQLRAAGESSGWIDLPPVTIPAPVVPIPTMLVCLQNASFTDTGVGLIMVPANSPLPLDAQAIKTTLGSLNMLLSPFGTLLPVLATVIGQGNTDLVNAISNIANAQISFSRADGISDLSNIEWQHHWYGDRDAEDDISALILLAPPMRQVQCFNDRDYNGGSQGQFNVTIDGGLIAELPDLNSGATPPCNPSASMLSVPYPAHGGGFLGIGTISNFNDQLSSIRFTWAT